MYRLARIRLAGVGPADARFDKPSPDALPFEVSCIGAVGAPEDTVVWLENGGGKTVFLALLFHVLRPDKAAQIGNDEKGRRADIPDFVMSNDVAHVVCEWVADDSDARLITGLVADRRGANVNRTWYLLAVRDGAATLDDLAFDVDGRRVPAARYVESLEQLASRAGKSGRKHRVELTKTGVQRQWFETLADHDLDPALFEYQVRMNRSEGGATSLFRFTSAERFVEFFLQLTMNPDTVAALSEELGRVADKVLSLPRKELELAHATGAVERLSKLASAWSEFEAADAARTQALQDAELLHDRLAAAVAKASAVLTATEKQVELAEAERVAADKKRRESDTRAKTVAIALADSRVGAIQAEVKGAAAAAAASRLTADAWPRVPQMLRRSAIAGEIAQVRVALDAANEDAAPLREQRDALLRTLRGVIDAQVRAADGELTNAAKEWAAADEAEREADRALVDATGAGKELDGRIREITRQVEAHHEAVKAAVTAGLLPVGVAPQAALDQARSEAASAAREAERLKDVRREFAGELPELRSRLRRAAAEASQAEQRHAQRREIVAGVLGERARLAAHPLLAELGAEDADLELVGADLANRVATEADRQRALAIASVAANAEDQRAVDTLDRDRLLPARAEVETFCRTLAKEGVTSAVPGWRYLVEAVPAARHAAAIAAHPALVDGIVVATHELDRAREVLAGTTPSAAILIAAGAVLADSEASAAAGWVVPPAAALHDRSAAEAELDRRRDRITSSAVLAEGIAAAEHTARALAGALTTHINTWPPGALPAAVAERDELGLVAEAARTAAVDAQTGVETVEGWLEETDGQLEHQRTRLRSAEGRAARLEQLATAASTTATAERELASLQQERAGRAKAADRALAARTAERARREAAAARKATAQQALDGASQVLAGLPEVGDGPAAPLASLAELRAAYESADRNLAEATTDSELSRQLARLESDRAEAEAEWQALDGQLRACIEELAASPAAVDPVARRAADQEARRAAGEAAALHAGALGRLSVAKATRRDLPDPEPTWPVEPFDIPTDILALEAFSISLEAEAARAREQRAIAIDKVTAAKADRDARLGEHDALAAQVAGLTHGVGEREVRPTSPFEGDAAAEVRSALKAITDAGHIREDADLNWRRAATAAARWARDGKWKELTGDLARRLRDEDPRPSRPGRRRDARPDADP